MIEDDVSHHSEPIHEVDNELSHHTEPVHEADKSSKTIASSPIVDEEEMSYHSPIPEESQKADEDIISESHEPFGERSHASEHSDIASLPVYEPSSRGIGPHEITHEMEATHTEPESSGDSELTEYVSVSEIIDDSEKSHESDSNLVGKFDSTNLDKNKDSVNHSQQHGNTNTSMTEYGTHVNSNILQTSQTLKTNNSSLNKVSFETRKRVSLMSTVSGLVLIGVSFMV